MKKKLVLRLVFFISAGCLFSACNSIPETGKEKVITGAEVLLRDYLPELSDKKIGLFMNPTARAGSTHMLDTLLAQNLNITALFAPEHGFRGEAGAGENISSGVDSASGLPVYSLYAAGRILKPDPGLLQQTDVILFDMQDVGARFYTYNVSMKLLLEAAAGTDTEIWILDRPNPAGGNYVAGWVLEDKYRSDVGAYPIPAAHGLTLGELALMAAGENWLDTDKKPRLKVIEMEGWQRSMTWPDTGLPWYPPSPNLPYFENAYAYLGTCFFEGTTLSEGRGTESPFLIVGSPKTEVSYDSLAALADRFGVKLDTLTFTPVSIPEKAPHPKYKNMESRGAVIENLRAGEAGLTDPVRFGIALMQLFMRHTPGAEYTEFIKKLAGSEEITTGTLPDDWGPGFEEYLLAREKYLLYQ